MHEITLRRRSQRWSKTPPRRWCWLQRKHLGNVDSLTPTGSQLAPPHLLPSSPDCQLITPAADTPTGVARCCTCVCLPLIPTHGPACGTACLLPPGEACMRRGDRTTPTPPPPKKREKSQAVYRWRNSACPQKTNTKNESS